MRKLSLSLHHRKKQTYSRLSYRFILYSIRMGDFYWCKCQKQPLQVFCEKMFSLNFTKLTRNSCDRANTCEFCKIFENTFFTEQIRTTASESGYCNNEARDIDCICCTELDAMLIATAKIPEREESNTPSSFYGRLPYQLYLPDIRVLLLVPGVAERNKKAG